MEGWKTDVKDWEKVGKDTVNFYLAQAELHLKSNIELSDRITARGTWLLSAIIPIAALVTSYILNQTFLETPNLFLIRIASSGLSVILICLILLSFLVGTRKGMFPGGQPREIFTSNIVDTTLNKDEQYSEIVITEIQAIQDKIDYTKRVNRCRLKMLSVAIWLIVLVFISVFFFLLRQISFFV